MICFDPKSPKNQDNPHVFKDESGSAIIWVFVVIALFIGLTFTMSKGSRTGSQNIDRESAQLAADELISYARTIKDAVKTLRINGCDANDISFANSKYNIAAHIPDPVSAPADKSCHIFDINGGGLRYLSFDTIKTTVETKQAIFVTLNIQNIGTATDDLVMVIDNIPLNVCEQMNKKLHKSQSVFSADFDALLETGEDITTANCPECASKRSGCAADSSDNVNNFYTVLLTR